MTDEPIEPKALDPDPAERARQQGVAQITQVYWEALESLKVTSYVIGIPLGEYAEGHGALRCVGRADIVLNLIAGLINMLTPQDFDNLLTEMAVGQFFAAKRRVGNVPEPPAGKPN